MNDPVLTVTNLFQRCQTQTREVGAASDINLTSQPEDTLTVVGPNGRNGHTWHSALLNGAAPSQQGRPRLR